MRFHGPEADRMRARYLEELLRESEPELRDEKTERMVKWLESVDVPDGLQLSAGVVVVDGKRFREVLLDRVRLRGRVGAMTRDEVRRLKTRLGDP